MFWYQQELGPQGWPQAVFLVPSKSWAWTSCTPLESGIYGIYGIKFESCRQHAVFKPHSLGCHTFTDTISREVPRDFNNPTI